MRKLILLSSIIFYGLLASFSSGDDKTLNTEAENAMTKEAESAENLIFSTSNLTESLKFCIFGDYCDENGRHAEAIQYEVSAWTFSGDSENPKGELLYENQLSPLLITDNEDGTSEQSAEPLCLDLPDTQEEDQYYLEIYYGGLIRSGVITEAEIRALYDGEDRVDYYQFREGNCNLQDSPELF